MTTNGQGLFSIPANAFDNGGSAPINVEVTLANGSALPDFIVFNPDDMSFTVDGLAAQEAGVEEVIIRVTGTDGNGSSASGTFIIVIVEGEEAEVIEQEPTLEQSEVIETPDNSQVYLLPLGIQYLDVVQDESPSQEDKYEAATFYDELATAANEDKFENKMKQLLDDIAELFS